MPRPGYVRQPGAALNPRILALPARGRAFSFVVPAGRLLIDGIAEGFAAEGFSSGTATFRDLALGPFGYVIPGLATNGRNAAFYSQTFRPGGVTRAPGATMTFGQRGGAPFFHCHGLWRLADGRQAGGHMLPEETFVAEDAIVTAFGIDGAAFEWAADREINFTVPGPVPRMVRSAAASGAALVLRLRPNQDLCGAIESACAAAGFARAVIHGGVGSTIGALFEDGREAPDFATEVYIREGVVEPGPGGAPVARIDVGLIDFTGRVVEGVLARGENPVLMTFELVLEAVEGEIDTNGH